MLLLAATLFVIAPDRGMPAQRHESDAAARVERVTEEPPKSIWRVDTEGTAVHLQTTLTCPPSVGTFERTLLAPYDNFGFDVGCNLDSPNLGRISMYLAKRNGWQLAEDFASAQAAIKQVSPDVVLVDGTAPSVSEGGTFLGATFVKGDGRHTGLWVADVSGWTLTFRATYPADKQREVVETLSTLAAQAQTTAGMHLAECAAAPAVVRNGTRIPNGELITRLVLIGGLSAQANEDTAIKDKFERWCVEDAIRDAQTPLLFWRNVANETNDGRLDRFSLMTLEDPPIWNIAANMGANLLVDKGDEPAPNVIHELTETEGDTTLMFAFFRGRPSLTTLTPLVRDIVLGKTKPIAKANGKTGVVTIPKKRPGT